MRSTWALGEVGLWVKGGGRCKHLRCNLMKLCWQCVQFAEPNFFATAALRCARPARSLLGTPPFACIFSKCEAHGLMRGGTHAAPKKKNAGLSSVRVQCACAACGVHCGVQLTQGLYAN